MGKGKDAKKATKKPPAKSAKEKRAEKKLKKSKVLLTEDYDWNGDTIEAYAFGYLSVRRLLNLPITFPKTTGTKKPLTGGRTFNCF